MRRGFLMGILLWGSSLRAGDTVAAWQLAEWPAFVEAVTVYQKKHPTHYRSLETTRLDLLPPAELAPLVQHYGKLWLGRDKNLRYRRDIDKASDKVSRDANEALDQLLRKMQKAQPRLNLNGGQLDWLKSIPTDQRVALTPLDDLFKKSSEAGKKIASDLSLAKAPANLDAYRYDAEGGKLVLQNSQDPQLNVNYTLKLDQAFAQGVLRLRGLFGVSPDPVGTDLSINADYLSGKFFNAKSSDPQPFGTYPQGKNLWVDEKGATHFGGDGHKH